ncbi:phosphonate ABC transporter ATP-binding protein [Jeotgalibacillus haloalkalitolerans]|uniref:Phosphonate ABC transporter ATP-binding protein n=1 Tax=Jeotgalibacillus haloalkalitolerans TaxID=3104292 RepID=A0ABU5KJ81_9BACL|nr:phosphonate ABC transporter ATP-binding protein [Jeotgalibacillus sp. HH7-29]MDZ5710806.1 phosphonate ABC transporter ATP-binding protein [Jeotgalibacillus sp. HH7-29]
MIECKNVSVTYPNAHTKALQAIDLTFKKGEFICVLGKSGAGKSTFIRCLNGLQTPTEGDVIYNGQSLRKRSEAELRKIRQHTGMIFQHFNLIPRLSVMQNVLTGMFGSRSSFKNLIGLFTKEEKSAAHDAIRSVGLDGFENRRVEQLSGGQKQRVGIARALVQQPAVLLGDEPVASLDPGTANQIFTLLRNMHDDLGLLTMINVHDLELAKKYADRVIALKDGQVIFDGPPAMFGDLEYKETYGETSLQSKL